MPLPILTLSAALVAFAPPIVPAPPPVVSAPPVESAPLPGPSTAPTMAPVVAPTMVPAVVEAVPPAARLAPSPVRYKGTGLLVAGSVVGGLGLMIKLGATVSIANGISDGPPTGVDYVGVWGTVALASVFYNPLIGTGLGLLGGGFGRRGRWAADQDLFRGAPPIRRPRQAALGWGLFGGGVALWAATRVIGVGVCATERCTFRVLEGGYYAALGMTGIGLPLGAWSSGYNGYARQFAEVAQSVRVAPLAGRSDVGLSVSGRF